MIPTLEEYQKALKIVDAYKAEEKLLYEIKVDAFEKDLKEYFDNNLIEIEDEDGFYLKEFRLEKAITGGHIIPINPSMDEIYDGDYDEDIKKLCQKHVVKFRFPYWCYGK